MHVMPGGIDFGVASICRGAERGSDEATRLTAKTAVGAANCGYFSRVLRGALWGSWRVSAGLSWGGTGGGGRTRILWDRGQPALRVWRGAPGPFYLRNHFSWIIGLDGHFLVRRAKILYSDNQNTSEKIQHIS